MLNEGYVKLGSKDWFWSLKALPPLYTLHLGAWGVIVYYVTSPVSRCSPVCVEVPVLDNVRFKKLVQGS